MIIHFQKVKHFFTSWATTGFSRRKNRSRCNLAMKRFMIAIFTKEMPLSDALNAKWLMWN